MNKAKTDSYLNPLLVGKFNSISASGNGNSNLSTGVSIFGDPLNSGILRVMLPPLPRNTVALGNAKLKEYDS